MRQADRLLHFVSPRLARGCFWPRKPSPCCVESQSWGNEQPAGGPCPAFSLQLLLPTFVWRWGSQAQTHVGHVTGWATLIPRPPAPRGPRLSAPSFWPNKSWNCLSCCSLRGLQGLLWVCSLAVSISPDLMGSELLPPCLSQCLSGFWGLSPGIRRLLFIYPQDEL